MNTIPMFRDRRQNRSEKTQRAIRLQLEHICEEYQFDRVVVGDRDGLLVSSATDDGRNAVAAAFAPYIGEAAGDDRENFCEMLLDEIEPEHDPAHVVVRSFPAEGVKLYACIVSPRRDGVDLALDHTIEGIRRIFRTTKAA